MVKKTSLVTVLVLLALLTSFASAEEVSQAPESIMQAISDADGLEKYPDANAVIIFDSTDVKLQPDGSYLDTHHALIKILTEAGKKQYGEQNFHYYRVYDKIKIHTARVIKPDGRCIDVPADMIKDITATITAQMNIYDEDARQKVVTFKNIEIGDAIEYLVVDSCFNAPMDSSFSDIRVFQIHNPIILQTYAITCPNSMSFRYAVRDGELALNKIAGKNSTTYRWTAQNVDRIIQEPAMPSLHEFAPRLIVSTIENWEDVSRWYYRLSKPKLAVDDSLRMEVQRLTASCETEKEKVFAIYHFVAQKVRYMGLGTGVKKGFEPKPATETYQTRYGVCRDVATLMTAMLNEAQIPANVVLTGAGYEMEKEIPNIWFNHAIVALKNENDEYYYADPTVENNPDLLLSAEHEQDVLICTPSGEPLGRTPFMPAEQNMGYLTAHSELQPNGDLASELTFTTDGIYDMAFRSFCKSMPPQQIQNIWHQILQSVYTGATLTKFEMSDTEDLYQPFTMKIAFEIKDYALDAGKYLLVKLPLSTGRFELMSRSIFRTANLPERKYPWKINTTFGAREEETLIYPASYRIKAVPNPQEMTQGDVTYSLQYSPALVEEPAGKPAVNYVKELKINSKQLSREEYLKLKEILRQSAKSGRGEVILVKSDAE